MIEERIINCALCGGLKKVDNFGDLHHIGEMGEPVTECPGRTGALHFNEKSSSRA